jgi:hypothetical protein
MPLVFEGGSTCATSTGSSDALDRVSIFTTFFLTIPNSSMMEEAMCGGHTCDPSFLEGKDRRIEGQGWPGTVS